MNCILFCSFWSLFRLIVAPYELCSFTPPPRNSIKTGCKIILLTIQNMPKRTDKNTSSSSRNISPHKTYILLLICYIVLLVVTKNLSILTPSISITSKRKFFHCTTSPLWGICSKSSNTKPPTVLKLLSLEYKCSISK